MSWRQWRPGYQVPKTIENLVNAGILKDKTHQVDRVPHFEAILGDGSELVLWVDHPKPESRALPDGPRYGLEIYRKGKWRTTVFESDNMYEALLALRGVLEDFGGLRSV